MPGRRSFLKSTGSLIAATALRASVAEARSLTREVENGETLPAWEPGILEIHHIDTGRGNASLILGPDGTCILIDAGEGHSAEKTMAPARPNATRRAGEWIARYVQRQLKRTAQQALDVMLLTHLHGDHVGEPAVSSPQSAKGDYKLTGAADVADAIQVRELIDRGWPDYNDPAPPQDATSRNYIALAKSMAQRGTTVQQAKAGSRSQLALRHEAARYSTFNARILSVNGHVWTGQGEDANAMFPPLVGLGEGAAPSENMCCVSLRLQYGAFRYYSGGDLTCDTSYRLYPWHDIESPVATAAGQVSVAMANHHGYFDACGPAFVRTLRPRVWVLPTWHASHPAMNVLANIFSTELYPCDRSVFATAMTPEALLTTARFSDRLSSSDGHVVVRVAPPGDEFTVHVISARDELGIVEKTFGPFSA
jgi:Metallo-beta-lactamase superfamily